MQIIGYAVRPSPATNRTDTIMNAQIIDLRSDTVTVPCSGMRRAMAEAEVGDDVYDEDPTVNRLQARLAELGVEQGLLVTADMNENLYLSSRNIPGVYAVDVGGIDPVSLVAADKVVITVDAIAKIEEWLG